MLVTNDDLETVLGVLDDRIEDYFENCRKYEGEDECPMYFKGYGEHLVLARKMIACLKSGEFEKKFQGGYEFPFEDMDLEGGEFGD